MHGTTVDFIGRILEIIDQYLDQRNMSWRRFFEELDSMTMQLGDCYKTQSPHTSDLGLFIRFIEEYTYDILDMMIANPQTADGQFDEDKFRTRVVEMRDKLLLFQSTNDFKKLIPEGYEEDFSDVIG